MIYGVEAGPKGKTGNQETHEEFNDNRGQNLQSDKKRAEAWKRQETASNNCQQIVYRLREVRKVSKRACVLIRRQYVAASSEGKEIDAEDE